MLNSNAKGSKMQKAKQYITVDADGYSVDIDVNEKCGDYTVTGICFYVAKDEDEGCGDLAVNYDISELQNDETARTAGMLLLRNMHSDDEVTKAMGHFYWDGAFTERLNEILAECGFTACNATTSEWGMQDEGRASYDAYDLADEVRNLMQNTVVV
jgi:hypothetical protein